MPQGKYELAEQIISLLETDLAAAGFELLDVRIFRGGGRLQVRVYVDTAAGINLDGCARASRTAGMLLEESGLITGRYVIEVSSPGVRRPLRKPAHFLRWIGEELVVLTGPVGRPLRLPGQLLAADESGIRMRTCVEGDSESGAAEEIELAYADILEANLEPEFDAQALIRADRRQRKEARRQDRQARREQRQNRRRRPKR